MFINDAKSACRETTSEQPLRTRTFGDVDELIPEKLYVTPHVFFDEKEFELFLNFISQQKELKKLIFLPALPVYGKEGRWEHQFTEGDERANYAQAKSNSFTSDWYTNLNGGWLDKFNRLCKQVGSNTKIDIGLFIPKQNSAKALELIKQWSFGREITSMAFDYSPMHMICYENNKPVYIFEIPTIFQANQWECGYLAIFNACILYKLLNTIQGTNFLYRLNLKKPNEFEQFYKMVAGKYPTIVSHRKQHERLHLNKGIEVFDTIFGTKIEDVTNVLLIVQTDGPKNLGHDCRYGIMKKNFSTQKPLVVIFKSFAHWNCFVFTKTAIFVLDSSSACQYTTPEFLMNLYRYLFAETEETADGTDNPFFYCDIRNLQFKKD
jgi:hypothetical protein